jgi:hypothetical protein
MDLVTDERRRVRGADVAAEMAASGALDGFIPFLAFPPELRRVIYTTNASESLNYQLRSLRDRLTALDRALHRLDDGSYGRSIRSGVPIPDERLEADPAAELTVEEAAADEGVTG